MREARANPKPATLRSTEELRAAGLIEAGSVDALEAVASRYAIAVTPEMAALIDRGDPADPIARQFVPDVAELNHRPEELADPIGDGAHSPLKGIVHRYPDRVLLKPLHVCPVYCRFCFRREMVGPEGLGTLSDKELAAAFDYVSARPEIFELIVTGGDPFMLSPRRIAAITERAAMIRHLKVLRWHTRVPLVDPRRVTGELLRALRRYTGATYVGLHANHPGEFTDAGRMAVARLVDAGIVLVSQTVLLKGVNDDVATMEALMRAFLANRVKPYYLHHADLAPGTSHFRTTIAEGQALMRALRGRLSGMAQPTYVLDIPGGHGKVPVGPDYLEEGGVRDPGGEGHAYPTGDA